MKFSIKSVLLALTTALALASSAYAQAMSKAGYCKTVPDCEVLNMEHIGNSFQSTQKHNASIVIEYCKGADYKILPAMFEADPNIGTTTQGGTEQTYTTGNAFVLNIPKVNDGTFTSSGPNYGTEWFGYKPKVVSSGVFTWTYREISSSNLCTVLP